MLQFFYRRLRRDERGFTLIELLIVIAIIAILAAILIPNFLRARRQSLVSATKGNMKNIATALESYFVDKNAYVTDIYSSGSNDTLAPNYTRAVPNLPGDPSVKYGYVVSTVQPNQDYVICDNATDTINNPGNIRLWYYMPGGGLNFVDVSAGGTVTVDFNDTSSGTCP